MQKITNPVLIMALFVACQSKQEADTKDLKEQPKINSTVTSQVPDKGFNEFLERFNEDSSFQMSRVEFPLKGKVVNLGDEVDGPETLNDTIYIEEYWIKDFSYNEKEPQKYEFTREVQVKGNTAMVEINGREDGLSVTYTFRKIKGQWRLVWFEDYST